MCQNKNFDVLVSLQTNNVSFKMVSENKDEFDQ